MSFWTEADILRYLKEFNIPYASVYGEIIEDKSGKLKTTGESRTGCCYCPISCHLDKSGKFQRLKITRPDIYDYVINELGFKELLSIS